MANADTYSACKSSNTKITDLTKYLFFRKSLDMVVTVPPSKMCSDLTTAPSSERWNLYPIHLHSTWDTSFHPTAMPMEQVGPSPCRW
ncbi:hypothetical protein JTB14_034406 [Gonioctena quinquepunctata]|nr:hypothetical protein JTB14_034406 [Gonioctena quinquepunctata]